jgi:hypothetical protein
MKFGSTELSWQNHYSFNSKIERVKKIIIFDLNKQQGLQFRGKNFS